MYSFVSLFIITILRILWKTGLWFSILLYWLIDEVLVFMLLGERLTPRSHYAQYYPVYEKTMFVILALPIVICLGAKVVKFFKNLKEKIKAKKNPTIVQQ